MAEGNVNIDWMDRLKKILRSVHFSTKCRLNHTHTFKAAIAASQFSSEWKARKPAGDATRMKWKVAGGQPFMRSIGLALRRKVRVKIGILAGQVGSEEAEARRPLQPGLEFCSPNEFASLNFSRIRTGDFLVPDGLINVENLRSKWPRGQMRAESLEGVLQ